MRVGLELGAFEWPGGTAAIGDTVARFAQLADEAGFSSLSTGDHLWQGFNAGGERAPYLECFTTLAVMAAHSRHCRISPVVAGVHFRHPSLLAKTVTTLDVLSGGRASVGLGVGWNAEEAVGSGIAFPPVAERFEMLEETLAILHGYWHGEEGDGQAYEGRHYRLERVLGVPQSITRPHPPIMLGGAGDKTLRLVARYGDACNLYPTPDMPDRLERLREICAEVGRDYDEIEKTCCLPFDVTGGGDGDDTRQLLDTLGQLSGQGIETVIGIVATADPLRQVELIGSKVLPELAGE
ncbi:LLM class F420-dependent oxidoreductase [Saccharomonospora piscinae]|uniref:LLM class F420-dependent oxidoreductase n=1 Tax=Saccharomonospora piscinae TaxID=687388 RepID=A0A1V9A6M8_SACPI|nr:LLM class flavin-dependent oxidoreductase [Saccharomonospora piscinae]OQO92584.1 LLM class F420-dependent oxidoreductase [Saccharomonospora piscinae]TLW91705.1 LLM class flavin-dependent oxidoreductase [Saccharomonospora piscinae]